MLLAREEPLQCGGTVYSLRAPSSEPVVVCRITVLRRGSIVRSENHDDTRGHPPRASSYARPHFAIRFRLVGFDDYSMSRLLDRRNFLIISPSSLSLLPPCLTCPNYSRKELQNGNDELMQMPVDRRNSACSVVVLECS